MLEAQSEITPAPGLEVQVTTRDQFNITFRTSVIFPVKMQLPLILRPLEGDDSLIQVMLRSAFVLPDERIEYTGRLEDAPVGFTDWQGTVLLADQAPVGPPDPDSPADIDKRRGKRLHRTFQVMSRHLQHYKALSSDISETGLRLAASEALAPGRVLDLTMDFDDSHYPPLSCQAEVVWCRPKDQRSWWVGMKFISMTPTDREVVEKYIHFAENRGRRA